MPYFHAYHLEPASTDKTRCASSWPRAVPATEHLPLSLPPLPAAQDVYAQAAASGFRSKRQGFGVNAPFDCSQVALPGKTLNDRALWWVFYTKLKRHTREK